MKKDPLPRWPSTLFERSSQTASAEIVDQAQSALAESLNKLAVTDNVAHMQEAEEAITAASHSLALHIIPPAVAEVFLPDEAKNLAFEGFEKPTFNNLILLAQTVDATHDPAIQHTLEYAIINQLPHYGEIIAEAYVTALESGEPIMTEYVRLSSQEDDVLDSEIREPGPRPVN